MNRQITPGPRKGTVEVPASKSAAHRLMILAALGTSETRMKIACPGADIMATAACLNALGADITAEGDLFRIRPIIRDAGTEKGERLLPCGESGSTLRFLLPITGILGARVCFRMEGRLPERPLEPLDRVLTEHGMTLRRDGSMLYCSGKLASGRYEIPGDISSQYITGLLLALSMGDGRSEIRATGKLESAGYVTMTEDALKAAGIPPEREGMTWFVGGNASPVFPAEICVERDWSGAAFFLCMGAFSEEGITVRGMDPGSAQGDRTVLDILRQFGAQVTGETNGITVRRGKLRGISIDASGVPDIIPVLAAVAAGAEGETRIEKAGRLRLKESDRLKTTADMLTRLGAEVKETEDGLIIRGQPSLPGGNVISHNDHRIAMSAAVAAAFCEGTVNVENAECIGKSFPNFFEIMDGLEAET